MTRPDWRIAGAAGLLAGLTVGGFSIVAGSSLDRAVAAIELRDTGEVPVSSAVPSPDVGADRGAPRTPVPPGGNDPATASVASPEIVTAPIVTERATPRPPTVSDLDTDDAGSVDSVDSADATD